MSPDSICLTQPDDWHLHLRDGPTLTTTVAHSARVFARAIVMPNLATPVASVAAAGAYRARILSALPAQQAFTPLMTLYLTEQLAESEIALAMDCDFVHGVKFYPAGATTNSDNGVTAIDKVYPVLERMAELDLPLLLHGEVTTEEIDIFDREQRFIETTLLPLRERFPTLRMVLEHITTRDAVQFVMGQASNTGATITVHHLLYNRNDLLVGGVKPHFYCLPILKRRQHQEALVEAALSGDRRFFLGTDSAPHARSMKESACGCAGIYSAPAALELYAEFFAAHAALERLEAFASHHGPDFYRLPRNDNKIMLVRQDWELPTHYSLGDDVVVPLRAGQRLAWQVQTPS